MRRRYQRGSVCRSGDGRYWVGKWRDSERRHKIKLLGKVREMTKSEAQEQLASLMRPVNASIEKIGPTVNGFLEATFFPLMERKWKDSTLDTNRCRFRREIGGAFGDRLLSSLTREDLQAAIDGKEQLSKSTVSHLRWDWKQLFDVAVAEGMVTKNPALTLFVPRGCTTPAREVMTIDDVRKGFTLELRERLVFKLATVAGLRPGEIFGLRRHMVTEQVIKIQQRLYRGKLGTPKTKRSERTVAIAATVQQDIDAWLRECPDRGRESWLFPSEKLTTPVSKDNFVRRWMRPALEIAGIGWVTFQVMRRTHATLMRELGVDPKVVADLMGHDLNVNLNVYTQTSQEARQKAADRLNSAVIN